MSSSSMSHYLSSSSDGEEHFYQQSSPQTDDSPIVRLVHPNPIPTTTSLGVKRPRSSEPPPNISENSSSPTTLPPPSRLGLAILDANRRDEPDQPKPKGRPKGSKNKPKPQVIRTHVLEILPGSNIVEMVHNFSRTQNAGVSILNGLGQVKNVTFRNPVTLKPTVSLSGTHDLISINGFHVGPAKLKNQPHEGLGVRGSYSYLNLGPISYIVVHLASPNGTMHGGLVMGKLEAASKVLLNVLTFDDYESQRLPLSQPNHNQGPSTSNDGGSIMSGGSNQRQDLGQSSGPVAGIDDGLIWDMAGLI